MPLITPAHNNQPAAMYDNDDDYLDSLRRERPDLPLRGNPLGDSNYDLDDGTQVGGARALQRRLQNSFRTLPLVLVHAYLALVTPSLLVFAIVTPPIFASVVGKITMP
jgi:hypothetical protein